MKLSKKLTASLAGLALVAGAMPAAVQAAEAGKKTLKLKGGDAPFTVIAGLVTIGFVVLAASGKGNPKSP